MYHWPKGFKNPQLCKQAISAMRSICSPVSKRVLMHNLSYGNEIEFQDERRASKTRLHMKGCAPRLDLKRRKTASRKWPIGEQA